VFAMLLLAVFWYLRISEKGPIRKAKMAPPSPFASVGRYVSQPRLRLAWMIAFARSAFWVTFFVYVPILMVEGNAGELAGGIAIAAGNAMLLNNLLVTDWARRTSLRFMIALAFFGGAACTVATGMAGSTHAYLAGAAIVAASFFIAMLDGLGPIPFLRAVHAHERAQMTTIYRTYLDASELLPPFAYVFAFRLFGFSGAFWVLAALLAVTGVLCWAFLPKRM
ncbi:MAG: MFS transporter, partial [Pseudomonadota bacterium]|nr:MFS transporter [Pseudomonadota bacterium]